MNNRLPKILELENKNESPSVLCALIIRENNIGLLRIKYNQNIIKKLDKLFNKINVY